MVVPERFRAVGPSVAFVAAAWLAWGCGDGDSGNLRDARDDGAGGDTLPDVGDGGDTLDAGDESMPPDASDDASPDAPADSPSDEVSAGDGPADGSDAGEGDGSPSWTLSVPGLPLVHRHAPASDDHVIALVRRALDGLGFAPGASGAPSEGDRVFVGRYYLAWIDQTGFPGKINALFRLDGDDGDALDFALVDWDGRPVNLFVPGEDGDGRWPAGYPGAEHIEFPSRTPEPDDPASCASRDWCNQYAANEANDITDPDIPWWSACNGGAPSFDDRFDPVELEETEDGLLIAYDAPLVKEADGDGRWDGDSCHADWLFPDGARRRVLLRLGYRLYAGTDYVDRRMQVRNPAGNPAFDGPMSLIGGFVVTAWPAPHPLKRVDRFLRPELRDVADPVSGAVLAGGTFTRHDHAPPSGDEVFAWLDQPISLSIADRWAPARSYTLSHEGPSDNADVGICFCRVHGGLEMGGGLIHGGVSLPLDGGENSIEAVRRLRLPAEGAPTPPRTYEAETDLSHGTGALDGDGWAASVDRDAAGYIAYGPYATDWGDGTVDAVFVMRIDDNTSDDREVVTLDVYDASADEILLLRAVRRREFRAPYVDQAFRLDVDLGGRGGRRLETRAYWHDRAWVRLDKVVVIAGD